MNSLQNSTHVTRSSLIGLISIAFAMGFCSLLAAIALAPAAQGAVTDVAATAEPVVSGAEEALETAAPQTSTPSAEAPAAEPVEVATTPAPESKPVNAPPPVPEHSNDSGLSDPPAQVDPKPNPSSIDEVVGGVRKVADDVRDLAAKAPVDIAPLTEPLEPALDIVGKTIGMPLRDVLPVATPVEEILSPVDAITSPLVVELSPANLAARSHAAVPIASIPDAESRPVPAAIGVGPAPVEPWSTGFDGTLAPDPHSAPQTSAPAGGSESAPIALRTESLSFGRVAPAPAASAKTAPNRNQPSPLPSTPVPSTFAGGFGGSIFIPLAILSVLVALSMAAILRRVREAPGVPANPFLCELECPG